MRLASLLPLVVSITAFGLIAACGQEDDSNSRSQKPAVSAEVRDVTTSSDETPSYALTIKPIFVAKCTPCHATNGSNEGEFMFEAYSNGNNGAKDLAARIEIRTGNDTMPLTANKLTAAEKELLKTWIDAGTPE